MRPWRTPSLPRAPSHFPTMLSPREAETSPTPDTGYKRTSLDVGTRAGRGSAAVRAGGPGGGRRRGGPGSAHAPLPFTQAVSGGAGVQRAVGQEARAHSYDSDEHIENRFAPVIFFLGASALGSSALLRL